MHTPHEMVQPPSPAATPTASALCSLMVLSMVSTQAAETKPAEKPILTGEAWKQPASPSAWKVTIEAAPNTPDAGPTALSGFSVLRTDKFSVERLQYRNGQGSEVWRVGSRCFTAAPGSDELKLGSSEGLSSGELAEFKWINANLFRGPFVINGETFLVFSTQDQAELSAPAPVKGADTVPKAPQKKAPTGPIAGFPLKPGIQVAAINEKTRLPKFLQLGTEIHQYEFSTPSKQDLQIPPKVQTLVDFWAPRKIKPLPLP
jgi:hypothetical protein